MNAETLLSASSAAGALTNGVLAVLLLTVAIVATVVAKMLAAKWKLKKVEPDKTLAAWAELVEMVGGRIQVVLLPRIKRAMQDRVIDDQEFAEIRHAAVAELKVVWGDEGIKKLAEAAHIPLGGLGAWIVQQLIEKAAGEYKPVPEVTPPQVEVKKDAVVAEPAPVPAPVPVQISEEGYWTQEWDAEEQMWHSVYVRTQEIDPNDPAYTGGG